MLCSLSVFFALTLVSTDKVGAFKVTNYVANRTTLVHLFEWKWKDIAAECERFLGPVGYAGVQVSPITENVIVGHRPWYERYQPISYRWLTRSGNEDEFRDMLRRCNNVGVRVYVDIIMNHMSADHDVVLGTGGTTADSKILSYPAVPYARENFHSICSINDYNDPQNVRNCELVGLHDLDQSQKHVRVKLLELLNKAIDAGVAGFRVDAAKHMWPRDLKAIYSQLHDMNVKHHFNPGTRPFIFQEVIDFGGQKISKYEYNQMGAVTEFRFGRELSNSFRRNNLLKWFINWGEPWGLLPNKDALVFVDNHDTQRSSDTLTYKSPKPYKMAVAFMLAHPYGIPRVMSSFAFKSTEDGPPADGKKNILSPVINADGSCGNGWVCEHRWRQIRNMVVFRNYVGASKLGSWWDNGSNQIAFCRGNLGFVAFNAEGDLKQRLTVCLPPGSYCDVISGDMTNGRCTGKTVRVDEDGTADIEIRADEDDGVLAIHGGAKLA